MNLITRSQLSHSTSENKISVGRAKPVVSSDYVVGLTDGEGCFYILMKKTSKYKAGYGVQLHFHIKLNHNDKEVLEKVKNLLERKEEISRYFAKLQN